jgi:hypothetical protein
LLIEPMQVLPRSLGFSPGCFGKLSGFLGHTPGRFCTLPQPLGHGALQLLEVSSIVVQLPACFLVPAFPLGRQSRLLSHRTLVLIGITGIVGPLTLLFSRVPGGLSAIPLLLRAGFPGLTLMVSH